MLPTVELPRETERQAFVEKVRAFRGDPPRDGAAHARRDGQGGVWPGRRGRGGGQDVKGYHWVYTPYGPVYTTPTWYRPAGRRPGSTHRGVPCTSRCPWEPGCHDSISSRGAED